MAGYGKVEMSPNRLDWNPTPLPEQVVLVTTIDKENRPHVATKSRISVISYGPPTLVVFACRSEYLTAENIQETGQFVVNIPGDDLVATSWIIGSSPAAKGPELLAQNGLTVAPSLKVKVPLIAECRAHLECEVVETRQFGDDLAVFGEVVSASITEKVVDGSNAKSYRNLGPFFFLNAGWTASLGIARRVEEPTPGPRHALTVLATGDIDRLQLFYSSVFHWPVKVSDAEYVEFVLPGGRGFALRQTDGVKAERSHSKEDHRAGIELHFHCDNLPQLCARLVSAGAVEISAPGARDDGEDAAYFTDPDGNVLIVSLGLYEDSTKR
jgi:flavin reductase (DIM6/NTAB) family NADH-FMN oxidoreductase RutF/predicted enzyme related to lactoylglutathione lyase